MPSFDLSDPNSYTPQPRGNAPMKRNFSYRVRVNSTDRSGVSGSQFITVNSNDILSEEQILEIATEYARAGDYENVIGDIDDAEITSAMRSNAL